MEDWEEKLGVVVVVFLREPYCLLTGGRVLARVWLVSDSPEQGAPRGRDSRGGHRREWAGKRCSRHGGGEGRRGGIQNERVVGRREPEPESCCFSTSRYSRRDTASLASLPPLLHKRDGRPPQLKQSQQKAKFQVAFPFPLRSLSISRRDSSSSLSSLLASSNPNLASSSSTTS